MRLSLAALHLRLDRLRRQDVDDEHQGVGPAMPAPELPPGGP